MSPPSDPDRRARPRGGPLYSLLRWIGRHVEGFYAAVGAFLALGFAVAAGALLLFAWVASEVREGETQHFDEAILRWVHAHGTPWLDLAALEVTSLGATLEVGVTALIATAFLWVTRHRYSVLLLWTAILGTAVLNLILKAAFNRPRPHVFPWLVPHVGQSSFPSGHAMTSTVTYLTIAFLIGRLEPSAALRRATIGVAVLVVFLVGLSRVYLGVHYPSDVLAGWIAGVAWASFCVMGLEALRHFRGRKPDAHQVEEDLEAGVGPVQEEAG
ncbi:MAG: phosphatase PAP2 family protein [Gemmatimonadetes bacterium]|nr:phosphatase PAP2 family protein [Gemmatimonadota bacterium]